MSESKYTVRKVEVGDCPVFQLIKDGDNLGSAWKTKSMNEFIFHGNRYDLTQHITRAIHIFLQNLNAWGAYAIIDWDKELNGGKTV